MINHKIIGNKNELSKIAKVIQMNKSFAEQQCILWEASQKYINGEITVEELELIEEPYYREFTEAMYGLSKPFLNLFRISTRFRKQKLRSR